MVDCEKRESFISENLRLVNHLCKRFSGRGIEYDDLYGAGCVGLVKAVDAFDETLGYQFSTYAVPVILGEIRRLFRDGGSVKVSRSVKELALKVAKEKARLEHKLCREPKISEIAEALGVSAEDIVEAQNAVQPTVSLTIEDNDTSVQADIPVVSQDLFVENRLLIDNAVSKLTDNEQAIIRLRYFDQLTQSETAQRLSMTQVGVSRAEKKILLKLRAIIGSVA